MSQTQLGATGLSGSYMSLIEAGRRTARPRPLGQIAAALGCPTEYLRAGRDGRDDGELELGLRRRDGPTAGRLTQGLHATASTRVAATVRARGWHEVELDAR